MKPELQKKLIGKYPKLFKGFFIIECGDGWYKLLDRLCSKLGPTIRATRVREKFGTLRFYYEGGDVDDFDQVHLAECRSARICEVCGKVGNLRGKSWYTVRCEKHKQV